MYILEEQASKQASNRPADRQADRQAGKASKQASKQAGTQASMQASRQAKPETCKPAEQACPWSKKTFICSQKKPFCVPMESLQYTQMGLQGLRRHTKRFFLTTNKGFF